VTVSSVLSPVSLQLANISVTGGEACCLDTDNQTFAVIPFNVGLLDIVAAVVTPHLGVREASLQIGYYLFTFSNSSWEQSTLFGSDIQARQGLSVVGVPNMEGRYVLGGEYNGTFLNDVYYGVTYTTSMLIVFPSPDWQGRAFFGSVLLAKTLFVYGGQLSPHPVTETADVWSCAQTNLGTHGWTQVTSQANWGAWVCYVVVILQAL
jgi:hypothetical protein